MLLREKLVRAREARGLSIGKAAGLTQTVHQYALRKLESGQTDPARVTASTLVDLLYLYPEITIADFVGPELARRMVAIIKRPVGRPRKD